MTIYLGAIDYSDDTPDISFTYNRLGQPVTVTDAAGTRSFSYNGQFALTSEAISGIYNRTLNRTYTTAGMKGKVLGMSLGDTNIYTYGYDDYGRLNQIATAAGNFSYSRLTNSDLVNQLTRPNNVTTTYSYEDHRDDNVRKIAHIYQKVA